MLGGRSGAVSGSIRRDPTLGAGSFIDQNSTLTAGEKKRLHRLERQAAPAAGGQAAGTRGQPPICCAPTPQIGGLKAREARRAVTTSPGFGHQAGRRPCR